MAFTYETWKRGRGGTHTHPFRSSQVVTSEFDTNKHRSRNIDEAFISCWFSLLFSFMLLIISVYWGFALIIIKVMFAGKSIRASGLPTSNGSDCTAGNNSWLLVLICFL